MKINDRAIAIIYKDGKILMWWRYYKGNEYHVFVGGTQEKDETIEQTLEREVYEELNLKIKDYRKFYEWNHKYEINSEPMERIEHYFLIENFTGEIKLGDPELSRQNKENIYRPDWISLGGTNKIDYEPRLIFDLIKKETKYEQN